MHRRERLKALVKRGQAHSLAQLAKLLSVDKRTVTRYIKQINLRDGCNIRYNQSTRRFEMDEPPNDDDGPL
jgi:DNA-binding CsgD family transcriptional regulator